MSYRVAILGIYHESNTFLPRKTTFEDFKKGHLLFGEDIRREYGDAYHEIGGMLEVLDKEGMEAAPVIFAEATPSGIITSEAYEILVNILLGEFEKVGEIDGILVAAHGAAVSEVYHDMDGSWLLKLRDYVGEDMPIIVTLDPHANVSRQMVHVTNAMVAYKTNPHIDQRETGKEAAQLMVDTLQGKIYPVQSLTQPRVSISIEQQFTGDYPCKGLYELSNEILATEKVLSTSVLLGFPYADVEELGSSFIVVTNNDMKLAHENAGKFRNFLLEHKEDFVGEKITIEEALAQAKNAEKPVLLLDMGDNVGGGAPGDSTFLLDALEKMPELSAFVCLYDPEAVNILFDKQPGNTVDLEVGGKTDSQHGQPVAVSVEVLWSGEGVFEENQPRHGGQKHFNMGNTVIVKTEGGNTVMLTSLRMVPFSLNQLTTFNIDPVKFDVLVAKGVHAPVAAYEEVCKTIIRVDTPGITRADITQLPFKNRRKPLYPFEKF